MARETGLSKHILELALKNMIKEGYLPKDATIDQVIDMAYTCCEGIAWYANGKLIQWAND